MLLFGACATGDGNTYYQLPFESASNATTLSSVGASATTFGAGSAADVQSAPLRPFAPIAALPVGSFG